MSDFLMPSLGADMESAVLVEWLVAPGARLKRGDIIGVVETDKGAIDIEVFDDCVVEALVAPVGAEVKVDGVLARLRTAADEAKAAPAATPAAPQTTPPAPVTRVAPETPGPVPAPSAVPRVPAGAPRTVRASPAARRHAAALGVTLAGLRGTGVGGAICLADVAAAAAAMPPQAPRAARGGFDPRAMRRAIGVAMARAKREIPHFYLTQPIALGRALDWLAQQNATLPVPARMLPAVLLLKATALALAKVPELNGHYMDDAFRPGTGIHVGWAVSLRGGGLIAPAIHDADRLPLAPLMRALRDVVQRARGGGLRSSELMDSTATITSLGERSAATVLPILYPPQVAMIGFGSIGPRPWAVDDQVVVQPVVTATLAADHRVSDGHGGGRLLATIDSLLQRPELL